MDENRIKMSFDFTSCCWSFISIHFSLFADVFNNEIFLKCHFDPDPSGEKSEKYIRQISQSPKRMPMAEDSFEMTE